MIDTKLKNALWQKWLVEIESTVDALNFEPCEDFEITTIKVESQLDKTILKAA